MADTDKTAIEIYPGQMHLHGGLTIHGLGPNTPGDRHIACVVRYIHPDMAQQMGDMDFAMHARGADNCSNFSHVPAPTEIFSREALALYDKIRTLQAKIMMRDARGATEIYA